MTTIANTDEQPCATAMTDVNIGSEQNYFPMIDVLRGFAAVSVIVLHTIHHANWTSFPNQGPLYWFRQGGFGVDLFFVISGFVILHSALALREKQGPAFVWDFSIRRLARIVPLFYLTVLVSLLTINRDLLGLTVWPEHLLAHLTFIHTFDPNWFSSINGPNWSVGIEMHFYVLAALIAPALLLSRWRWAILVFGTLVALAWRYFAFVDLSAQGAADYFIFVRSVQLPGRLDEFAIGASLALFVRTPLFARLRASKISALVAGALSLIGLYYFFQWGWDTGDKAVNFAISSTLVSIAFAGSVLSAALVTSPTAIRLSTPLRYLGTISYGLYLWHLIVLLSVKDLELPPWQILVLTLMGTSLLAAASWHLLEQPVMDAIRRVRRASSAFAHH